MDGSVCADLIHCCLRMVNSEPDKVNLLSVYADMPSCDSLRFLFTNLIWNFHSAPLEFSVVLKETGSLAKESRTIL